MEEWGRFWIWAGTMFLMVAFAYWYGNQPRQKRKVIPIRRARRKQKNRPPMMGGRRRR